MYVWDEYCIGTKIFIIHLSVYHKHYLVGSSSATGAGSPIVGEAVKRISHALGAGSDPSVYDRAIQNSFVLSVDQAHAVHPNYAGKHEKVSNHYFY